jgi:hypothetical protein
MQQLCLADRHSVENWDFGLWCPQIEVTNVRSGSRRRLWHDASAGGLDQCGDADEVTFVQRFRSAANLNLHAHAIVLDGVFAEAPYGELRFRRVAPP